MRRKSGNVLIMTIAVTGFLLVGIALFALGYVRTLGQFHQQTSAIEAAALAASSALSKVVYNDSNFGFVGFCDYPPNQAGTKSGDNWYLPVTSINTLTGTVRLDMIIANALNDPTMQACALRDYNNFLTAKDTFSAQMDGICDGTVIGKDIDGNIIDPQKEAQTAYENTVINMTGCPTKLVPGTLKIQLGLVRGMATVTSIPKPAKYASLAPSMVAGNFYRAYINCPINVYAFVFAAASDQTKLVDPKAWEDSADDLPYCIRSCVLASADQETAKNQDGSGGMERIHATAAAVPGSTMDKRPAPGAFALTFTKNSPTEIGSLFSILTNPTFAGSPTDVLRTATGGDYPDNPLAKLKLDLGKNSPSPPIGQIMRLALYDWIRKAGTGIDIDSLVAAMQAPVPADGTAHRVLYSVDVNGQVTQSTVAVPASPSMPVAHRQLYAVSGLALQCADGTVYDIFVRDYCYKLGNTNGGIHAGEPCIMPYSPPPAVEVGVGWPDGGLRENTGTMGKISGGSW